MNCQVRTLAGLLCWLGLISSGFAQQYGEGFSRARPILRPSAEAPTATIRQIRFNGDRANPMLYSAGDDKLVRRWSIAQTNGEVTLKAAPPIAWPIYRAIRGVIYSLDVRSTKAGDRVAFGGVGAKSSWVNLLHVDRPDGAQLLLDQKVAQRDFVVYYVAMNNDATKLAVAHDRTGIVLVWNLDGEKAVGQALQLNTTHLKKVWTLAFNPSGSRLALAGPSTSGDWYVQEWNVASAGFVNQTKVNGSASVWALCWGNDNTWVAATSDGVVVSGKQEPHKHGDVRALAFGPGAYVEAVFDDASGLTEIKTWNGGAEQRSLPNSTFIGKDVALDISPDGRFIAAGGTVLDLTTNLAGYRIVLWDSAGRELTHLPDKVQRGAMGAPIANVGIIPGVQVAGGGKTPDKIGFAWGAAPRRNLPAYQQQFDTNSREIAPHTQGLGRETQPRVFNDATRIIGTQKFARIYLTHPESASAKIDPWGALPVWEDRRPTCYAVDRGEKLLAIGYSDGIIVCDLARLRGVDFNLPTLQEVNTDKAVLRSFHGHEGPVTCMSFDPGGKLLLSGSSDGTICAWNVADLRDPAKRPASELGVQFVQKGNNIEVSNNPPVGSLGAEAGFRGGQVIDGVEVAGVVIQKPTWLSVLSKPTPGKELLVTVRQPQLNKTFRLLPTPVSHDALYTFYPQQDRNWLLWTPEGHFDAPLEATERLAWHLDLNNIVAAEKVLANEGSKVFSGREFQELFQRKDIVEKALLLGQADKPRDAVVPPGLQINLSSDNAVELVASPLGKEPITELELWLNGYRLESVSRTEKLRARIPLGYLRSRGNQLTAVAAIQVEDPQTKKRANIYNRKLMRLPDSPGSAAPGKLHFVGVGVTGLDPNFPGAAPLEFAHHDAVELERALKKHAALAAGHFEVLADFEECKPPTEANIIAALDNLARQVRPDDLAIVFFSGHGFDEGGFKFIAKDTPNPKAGKITDQLINDKLALLSCRTLLMLDTCHAAGAQVRQNLQDWPGFGVGPMILAACDSELESFEHIKLKLGDGLRGHGLFTASLLECLTGQRSEEVMLKLKGARPFDTNADGRLSITEWCAYTKLRTGDLSSLDGPYNPGGKKAYSPKILPSLTFADQNELTFAPAPSRLVGPK